MSWSGYAQGANVFAPQYGATQSGKNLVSARLAQGTLEQVQVSNGEVFLLEAGALERFVSPSSNRMLILSPFDNSVIQRDRLKALFQFDYQIECYLPEVKRQYGYFCLPLLYGDEFIGRMNAKAHRKTGHLEIKALHFHPHQFDDELVIAAWLEAIIAFSQFQQCQTVSLTQVYPNTLIQRLQNALKSLT